MAIPNVVFSPFFLSMKWPNTWKKNLEGERGVDEQKVHNFILYLGYFRVFLNKNIAWRVAINLFCNKKTLFEEKKVKNVS